MAHRKQASKVMPSLGSLEMTSAADLLLGPSSASASCDQADHHDPALTLRDVEAPAALAGIPSPTCSETTHMVSKRGLGDRDAMEDSKDHSMEQQFTAFRSRVVTHLLGESLGGMRHIFFIIDPFSNDQMLRAPKLYRDINAFFAMFYYAGILAFTGYAIYAYASQTPLERTTLAPTKGMNPIVLNVTMACTRPYGCGTWASDHTSINPIVITQSWKSVPQTSPCYGKDSKSTVPVSTSQSWQAFFTVCYSTSPQDGIIFAIPYNLSSATFSFFVRSNAGVGSMFTQLDVAPNQWKTAFFSQSKHVGLDGSTSYQPYVGDLFYNGHPPSAVNSLSSTMRFRLQEFGYLTNTVNAHSLLQMFGWIGGFAGLWLSILGLLKTIVSRMDYAKYRDGTSKLCC